jgi:hypothetical protein
VGGDRGVEDLYVSRLCLPSSSRPSSPVHRRSSVGPDMQIDIAGDESKATKAIIDVYDIFGLANQILQGADLVRISDPPQLNLRGRGFWLIG